jgi:hypothetical protein
LLLINRISSSLIPSCTSRPCRSKQSPGESMAPTVLATLHHAKKDVRLGRHWRNDKHPTDPRQGPCSSLNLGFILIYYNIYITIYIYIYRIYIYTYTVYIFELVFERVQHWTLKRFPVLIQNRVQVMAVRCSPYQKCCDEHSLAFSNLSVTYLHHIPKGHIICKSNYVFVLSAMIFFNPEKTRRKRPDTITATRGNAISTPPSPRRLSVLPGISTPWIFFGHRSSGKGYHFGTKN